MPSERFLNLPAEKRRRIIQAAVAELSRVPFEEISINRIIHGAGIPRGSFYQYFADKLDLLAFVMREYRDSVVRTVKEQMRQGQDLFEVLRGALRCTVEFGTSPERIGFCKNIFTHFSAKGLGAFLSAEGEIGTLLDEFMPYLDLSRFKQADKSHLEELVDLLLAVMRNTVKQIFTDLDRAEAVMERFDRQMDMIQHGVYIEESQNTEGGK